MVKSMTGFGREHVVANGREIIVEIRSVNHRYYEFMARTPRSYGYLDEKLKTFLKSGISRGKVEVSVTIYNQEGTDAQIELNESVAKGYLDALRGSAEKLGLEDDLTLSAIMRLPDVFTVVKKTDDEEVIWNEVKAVAQVALDRFVGHMHKPSVGSLLYTVTTGVLQMFEEKLVDAHRHLSTIHFDTEVLVELLLLVVLHQLVEIIQFLVYHTLFVRVH